MTQFETKCVGFAAEDTHDRGYLCGLMPDISVFKKEDVADGSFIPMLVQTILELRAQKRGTGFSNEEKGQPIC
jgi:hypothetical protein